MLQIYNSSRELVTNFIEPEEWNLFVQWILKLWELADTICVRWFQEECSSLFKLKYGEAPQATKIFSLAKSRKFVSIIPLAVEHLTYCHA